MVAGALRYRYPTLRLFLGERAMKKIFDALARYASHLAATSVGFVILLVVVSIPYYGIKYLLPQEIAARVDWINLEVWVMYIDIALYALAILVWTLEFIAELVIAVVELVRTVIRFFRG
jgi:hypothetical protein